MKVSIVALLSTLCLVLTGTTIYGLLRSSKGRSQDYDRTIGRSLRLTRKAASSTAGLFRAGKRRATRKTNSHHAPAAAAA